MSLSKIEFVRQNGNLGGQPESQDGISALIFLSATTAIAPVALFSTKDVEDLGYTYANGTNGFKSLVNYHVSEYFKRSNSKLYLAASTTEDYTQIQKVKDFSNGEVKIYGVHNNGSFGTAQVTSLQTQMANIEKENAPAVCLYEAKITNVKTFATSNDLKTLKANFVSVLVGDDYEGQAKQMRAAGLLAIGSIGTALGMTSASPVQQSIAQGDKNVILDSNFLVPAFIDATKYSDATSIQVDNIDSNHYNFLIKRVGSAGTFYSFDYTCDDDTSDFFNVALNRVYNKARRLLYTAYLPLINSNLLIDAQSGKLNATTVATFKNVGNVALQPMVQALEVSGARVSVNANQSVLSTKKIEIEVAIVPLGFAKEIKIFLGYSLTV
jgi:hypothetical protein